MVTDLDILVSLGYTKELSRKALAETNGDRSAALEFIRTSGQKSNNDWKSYKSESDWKNNITVSNLPKDSMMRALWKSPVTVHVNSSYRAQDGSFLYRCKVITLTKDWVSNKSYEDFVLFKASLPFGTTVWFKNIFPSPWIRGVSSLFSLIGRNDREEIAEADRRRELLDEWIRELTLSETCMSNESVLKKTLNFFGLDGEISEGSSTASSKRENTLSFNSVSSGASGRGRPAIGLYDTPSMSSPSLIDVIKKIRTLNVDSFPMSISSLDAVLDQGPFKIDVLDFPDLAEAAEVNTDVSKNSRTSKSPDYQLEKDLVRDRLVINGKRHQGSLDPSPNSSNATSSMNSSSSPSKLHAGLQSSPTSTTPFLDVIVGSCVSSINEILSSHKIHKKSAEIFSKSVVRTMSRTESAYLSLLCVNKVIDLFPPSVDSVAEDDFAMPPLIVPESILADPILINLKVLERKSKPPLSPTPPRLSMPRDCCIDCEGQTSTVFRVCAGESMQTLLQFRVVYSRRVYGMLSAPAPLSSDSASVPVHAIVEKVGSAHLVFYRETKTTARDWN